MNLRDALRAQWGAEQKVLPDAQQYDPLICQCCGFTRKQLSDPECICDGTRWFGLPGGGVECEPHRFARAIGRNKSWFRR